MKLGQQTDMGLLKNDVTGGGGRGHPKLVIESDSGGRGCLKKVMSPHKTKLNGPLIKFQNSHHGLLN